MSGASPDETSACIQCRARYQLGSSVCKVNLSKMAADVISSGAPPFKDVNSKLFVLKIKIAAETNK